MSADFPEAMLGIASTATADRSTLVGVTAAGVWLMVLSLRGCVGRLARTEAQLERMRELHPEFGAAITTAAIAWRQMRSRNDVTVH